jgi:chemotaxis receptor (MCP) glutamine deamidase CheD
MQHYTLPKYKFKFYPKMNRTRYPEIALDIPNSELLNTGVVCLKGE